MSGRRYFLTNSGLSVASQVLLSGINFLIGLCLIRLGSKESYGLYSQLFAGGIFAVAILDSVLGSPLTTLAPGMERGLRRHVIAQVCLSQRIAALGLSTLMGLAVTALLFFLQAHDFPQLVGLAFGLLVFTSAMREYQRTVWFIELQVWHVFRLDAAFATVATLGGLLLVWLGQVDVVAILLLLSVANAVCFFVRQDASAIFSDTPLPSMRASLALLWDKGRWALPGTLVGWAGNYCFLYLSSALIGLAAAADINAARLLLVPVSLLVVAWSRVARPQASRLIQGGEWPRLDKLAVNSLLGIETGAVLYIGLLLFALPWLQTHVLGNKYTEITPLVWAWGGYFLINGARSIATTWLVSLGKFRFLFFQGSIGLGLMLSISWFAMQHLGTLGAIVALCVVEIIDLFVSWFVIVRYRKKAEVGG